MECGFTHKNCQTAGVFEANEKKIVELAQKTVRIFGIHNKLKSCCNWVRFSLKILSDSRTFSVIRVENNSSIIYFLILRQNYPTICKLVMNFQKLKGIMGHLVFLCTLNFLSFI